jgi:hypothetical protein
MPASECVPVAHENATPAFFDLAFYVPPYPPLHVSHTRNNALKDKKESRNGLLGGSYDRKLPMTVDYLFQCRFLLSPLLLR